MQMGTEAVKKKSVVDGMFDGLDEEIGRLNEVIQSLARRLNPVLIPEDETEPSDKMAEPDRTTMSPLAEQVGDFRARLTRIRQNLQVVVERIEL